MDIVTLALAKKYADEVAGGAGGVQGKNCTIQSITPVDGGSNVVFAWTLDDGTEKTQTLFVADGEKGDPGDPGEKGDPGIGIPAGGGAGQILAKTSVDDYDTKWVDAPSGSGGEAGVGIESIEQTAASSESGGENVWTATLTDGSQSEFIIKNGLQGEPGADGDPGADGITPTIGANGNWFIGNTDTGKPSQGASGADGMDGNDGFSPTITEKEGNTSTDYRLKVTNESGGFETPNLKAVHTVNNAEVYSITEEVVVGTWINGKPIYRRTLLCQLPETSTDGVNGSARYDFPDVSMDECVNIWGSIHGYADGSLNTGLTNASSTLQNHTFLYFRHITNTVGILNAEDAWSGWLCRVTVEYTKTTDTATIDIPDVVAMNAAYDEGVNSI